MESVYNLPIYGVIGEDFKYTDLLLHLHNAQKYTAIKLLIDSPGGFVDEGDRMLAAILATGKLIYSINTGDVCSKAVDFFLLANKGNRHFNPSRGQFLIHNPWGQIEGEANELIEAGKEMKKLESEAAQRYASATGADINIITSFMAENVPLTPEQVEQLGFADLITNEIKAVALINYKQSKMNNEEVVKKLNVLEALMLSVKAIFRPKSLLVSDVNGVELDFGADVTDPSQIVKGVSATVNGVPATGEYTMPDGSILKFENGLLAEIIMPETPTETPEMDALKAENEALRAEIAGTKLELQSKAEALQSASSNFTKIETEFKAFKSQFVSEKPTQNTPSGSTARGQLFIK